MITRFIAIMLMAIMYTIVILWVEKKGDVK